MHIDVQTGFKRKTLIEWKKKKTVTPEALRGVGAVRVNSTCLYTHTGAPCPPSF